MICSKSTTASDRWAAITDVGGAGSPGARLAAVWGFSSLDEVIQPELKEALEELQKCDANVESMVSIHREIACELDINRHMGEDVAVTLSWVIKGGMMNKMEICDMLTLVMTSQEKSASPDYSFRYADMDASDHDAHDRGDPKVPISWSKAVDIHQAAYTDVDVTFENGSYCLAGVPKSIDDICEELRRGKRVPDILSETDLFEGTGYKSVYIRKFIHRVLPVSTRAHQNFQFHTHPVCNIAFLCLGY